MNLVEDETTKIKIPVANFAGATIKFRSANKGKLRGGGRIETGDEVWIMMTYNNVELGLFVSQNSELIFGPNEPGERGGTYLVKTDNLPGVDEWNAYLPMYKGEPKWKWLPTGVMDAPQRTYIFRRPTATA